MKRVVVALAAAALLSGGGAARGQWEPFDPSVKKLMPKDQLKFVEKTEALAELHRTQLFRIKDAKKRGEENEQLAAQMRDLHQELVNKLKTEGLKDWVFRCDIVLPKFMFCCGATQPIHTNFMLPDDGKAKSPEDATLMALKPNDVFRFSTKPDSSAAMPKNVFKSWGPFDQRIQLGTVTKVEKLGVWSRQQKKVVAEEKKR